MNHRTNHTAANSSGEVPATQEGEKHPDGWGRRELRKREKTKGKGGGAPPHQS